jgi:hypothetical protein
LQSVALLRHLQRNDDEKWDAVFDWFYESNIWAVCLNVKWDAMHSESNNSILFAKKLMFAVAENVDVTRRARENGFMETPLTLAAKIDDEASVYKLIDRRADIEAVDGRSWTALHWAADNGLESSCKALLKRKANVNAQNNRGNTPLLLAAKGVWGSLGRKNGLPNVVRLLLEAGADAKMKNNSNETALQLSVSCFWDQDSNNFCINPLWRVFKKTYF